MRLFAVSDLHLGHAANRALVDQVGDHSDDWLILAGDIGENPDQLAWAFSRLSRRFARLIWVPGNHELWTKARNDQADPAPRGVGLYTQLVGLARDHGVLTPEDPYPQWPGPLPADRAPTDGPLHICPLFLLYDYGFRPAHVTRDAVRDWAAEDRILPVDELLLHPDPYPDRPAWCAARLRETAARLAALPAGARTVLINHWSLRQDLLFIRRVPRYAPWCGTPVTTDWHTRFNAVVVVGGHQHVPRTDWRDGTRFEEVSLGYPREWASRLGPEPDTLPLRLIL